MRPFGGILRGVKLARADGVNPMRFALVNPNWNFEGSIYFGCVEPHLPLELGYTRALLQRAGHEVLLVDARMERLPPQELYSRVSRFRPEVLVITTAPSYLFWRCAPPELRVPGEALALLRGLGAKIVVVGPHASTTPAATLRKLGADLVVLGECEDVIPQLADDWSRVQSVAYRLGGTVWVQGAPHATDMAKLPPLEWPAEFIALHGHHHHRFDAEPRGPGAEVEATRGCPYHCTFCAKDNFRNSYRKRPVSVVLEEVDRLLAQGVEYIYFIDEIFLPDRLLLEGLAGRALKFGVQTRIDLWSEPLLDLLGRAGCVSIEAGVESITPAGREELAKKCKLSTEELTARLIYARQRVPFVQANLIQMQNDDTLRIEEWREGLRRWGVWANVPVPMFAYPGSPDYTLRWGAPDDRAWERAHEHYLASYQSFSDIQNKHPQPLEELESTLIAAR